MEATAGVLYHLNAMGLQKGLGRIKHGIIGLAGSIAKLSGGSKLLRYFPGMTGLGQIGFDFRRQIHKARPSWPTFR
jgi:hypothetical protein